MENTSVKEEPNSESDSENKNDENDDCNSPEENQIEIKEHVLTKTEKDIEAFNSAEEKYEELPVKQKSFTVKDDFMDASDNPEEECSYPQSSYNKNEIKGVPDFDAISDTEVEKIFCTPMVICPELENIENTENQTHSLLSKKSREAYEKEYEYFDGWCRQNNVEEICESTLIAYFEKESKDKKPSSLWSKYSMLKACLSIKRHVDMSKFTKLSELLRGLAEGYEPKQTKILGIDDINRFMKEAHDRTYLAYKVILIIGYSGACRRDELTNLTIDDVEFENDSILVSISKTKTYIQRQFAIIDETWVDLIKKYVALRPQQITHRRFFLTYRNGSCLNCPIGINTIGRVPKQIAAFLKLPNPELFTGHCFRKSSVSHQVKGDYDPVVIKQEENETECTKPEISQGSKSTLSSLLPLKSRETYEKEYEYFDSWCQQNDVSDVTESTIIAYFDNESKDKKSSSLWAKYSMLKACLNVYNNIDISQFSSLLAFLKRLSEGYEPKQTKILEIEDINRFITEADDGSYLAHKAPKKRKKTVIPGSSNIKKAKNQKNEAFKPSELSEENDEDDLDSSGTENNFDEWDEASDNSDAGSNKFDDSNSFQTKLNSTNIIWGEDSSGMQQFPFTKQEKLLIPIIGQNPIDYFFHIITDEFLDMLVTGTNRMLSKHENKQSRIARWKKVTKGELLKFIGLFIHMGHIKLPQIQDYWRQDVLYKLHIFAATMSQDRFLSILRALNFTNNQQNSDDRLWEVRPLVDFFNNRMNAIYYPGRELSLNESMVFAQHIPNNKNKYGVKLLMLNDTRGLILKLAVFTGSLDDTKENYEEKVMNLLEDKLMCGHSIFLNNYCSYELAKTLLQANTNCTGTLKKIPEYIEKTKLKTGKTVGKYSDGILIGKFKDQSKTEIAYISSEFKNDLIVVTNRKGRSVNKTRPIIEHNQYKSRIDRQNEMISCYSIHKNKFRWSVKIFFHVLQMSMNNAYCMYSKYSENRLPFYKFRTSVVEELLQVSDEERSTKDQPKNKHILSVRSARDGRGKTKRKHCKSCYENKKKRKDCIYVCSSCPGEPGYCLDCAQISHQ